MARLRMEPDIPVLPVNRARIVTGGLPQRCVF
jgi:hypothetical protein